jgi:small subunit ribosomal protein S20
VPNTASAKKRVRQTEERNARNRWRRTRVKDAVKAFNTAVLAGDSKAAADAYNKVASLMDKFSHTPTMHKNTAARRKSRLAKRLAGITAKK